MFNRFFKPSADKKPQDNLMFGAGVCFPKQEQNTTVPASNQATPTTTQADSREFQFKNAMNGGFGN